MPSLVSIDRNKLRSVQFPVESQGAITKKILKMKSQVTPDRSAGEKDKRTQEAISTRPTLPNDNLSDKTNHGKKQIRLTAFFKSPAMKNIKNSNEYVTREKRKTSSTSSPTKSPKIEKPDPMTGNKESFREIVVGSVIPSLMSIEKDPLIDYEKYSGSPLPQNLSILILSKTPRRKLLDHLNEIAPEMPSKIHIESSILKASERTPAKELSPTSNNEVCSIRKKKTLKKQIPDSLQIKLESEKNIADEDEITVYQSLETAGSVVKKSNTTESVRQEMSEATVNQSKYKLPKNEGKLIGSISSIPQGNNEKTATNEKDSEKKFIDKEEKVTPSSDSSLLNLIERKNAYNNPATVSSERSKTQAIGKKTLEKDKSTEKERGERAVVDLTLNNNSKKASDVQRQEILPTTKEKKTRNFFLSVKLEGSVVETKNIKEVDAVPEPKDTERKVKPPKASATSRSAGKKKTYDFPEQFSSIKFTTGKKVTEKLKSNTNERPELTAVDLALKNNSKKLSGLKKQDFSPTTKTTKSRQKSLNRKLKGSLVVLTTSPVRLKLIDKNTILRKKARNRLETLSGRASGKLEEEKFDIPEFSTLPAEGFEEELSPLAVTKLASLVQESNLPLSEISKKVFNEISKRYGKATLEGISENIKMYFTREYYLADTFREMKHINRLEDVSNRMWRWEILSLELLPEIMIPEVRKARVARKKIRAHSKAIVGLLKALEDADKVLFDSSSEEDNCEKYMSKVEAAEENVLKQERVTERTRLMEESKQRKEEMRKQKLLDMQKEKHFKKEEVEKRKAAVIRRREEEKQRKKVEQEKCMKKDAEEKSARLKKNKSRMLGFFSVKQVPKIHPVKQLPNKRSSLVSSDEAARFWETINSRNGDHPQPLFKKISESAKLSRKKCITLVPTMIYVTVIPSDPFSDQQPYAEQRTKYFPNKYKFLSFFEDHRPAYYGTWSKRSKAVTGKTPFGQENLLNYNEDSEAEWEEGDDEMGEDLQDETGDQEEEIMDPEEGDMRAYNYEDGWMAEDDDLIYENEEVDDETKLLRKKKKNKNSDLQLSEEIVAPSTGGEPLLDVINKDDTVNVTGLVYMSNEDKGKGPLQSGVLITKAEILSTDIVCLDIFPPNLIISENLAGDPSQIRASVEKVKSDTSQEISRENLKRFAAFIHHNTLPSKDSLVEEFRITHPLATSTRKQATRKLDSIATKRKNPGGPGVIWEVKRQILENLDLSKQLAMKLPEPPKKQENSKSGTNKKSKTSNAVDSNNFSSGKEVEKKRKGKTKKRKSPPLPPKASLDLFANFVSGNKKSKKSF